MVIGWGILLECPICFGGFGRIFLHIRKVNMKKSIVVLLLIILFSNTALAEDKPIIDTKSSKYFIEVKVTNIPKDRQTLFIPIQIDTMVLDFDKVALEGLSALNILAVASGSKDKAGPGVGLLKLDDRGLPAKLSLKVFLKPVSDGNTDISLFKVADEPVVLSKGAEFNKEVTVQVEAPNEITVNEATIEGKKKLQISENKLTLHIQRPAQKTETIFIPIVFDKTVLDLDESFGHAIISPGIAAKTFSSSSLSESGAGVEVILSEAALKDFTLDLDLIPKKQGTSKISLALPQNGRTAVVRGPVVEITPSNISVAKQ